MTVITGTPGRQETQEAWAVLATGIASGMIQLEVRMVKMKKMAIIRFRPLLT